MKDDTKSGWYVGYVIGDLATGAGNTDDPITVNVPAVTTVQYPAPPIDYATLTGLSSLNMIT